MPSAGIRQCLHDVTFYLITLIFITTLGPLQFGFHLVGGLPIPSLDISANLSQAELNAPQDVITCKKASVTSWREKFTKASAPKGSHCIPMNEAEFAALSSMFVIGGLLGALCAGPGSTRWGRLLTMRLTAVCFVLGSVLETMAGSVPIMSLGRFLAGCGAGASTVIVPLYISEIAPPKERGLFGSMTQISINIGIVTTQTLGYFLSKGSLWRVILAVGAGIGFVQGLGLLFVPESPAWLAAHQQPDRAMKVLQRIRGPGNSISDETKDWELPPSYSEEERLMSEERDFVSPLLSHSSQKSVANVGFFEVFRDPLYRPAIMAVIGIMFAQQFCGINSIIMYSVSLLSGVLPVASSLVTIIISVVNLFTTIACAPLPDKIGRKSCLLLSIAGMGSMSFLLAVSLRASLQLVSGIAVIAFVAFFATGLGPVPFMMASELVGQEAVGATQSWCLAANYFSTFLVAQFFPLVNTGLNNWLGGRGWAFFIFTGLAVLSGAFVACWVPETKGKKDVEEVWGRTRRVD